MAHVTSDSESSTCSSGASDADDAAKVSEASSLGLVSQRLLPAGFNVPSKLLLSDMAARLWREQGPKLALACVLHLVLGVVVLKITEGWPVISSLYVIVQVVTTIGFGDITPKSPSGRVFMAVYSLRCLVLLAYALSFYFAHLLDDMENQLRSRLQEFGTWETRQGTHDEVGKSRHELVSRACIFFLHLLVGVVIFGFVDRTPNGCVLNGEGLCESDCILHMFGDCKDVQHSWTDHVDALYMSVIALTTVGFGDICPKSSFGRMVAAVWMVSGVHSTGKFLGGLQEYFCAGFMSSEVSIAADDIEMGEFEAMDQKWHGQYGVVVTRGEFQTYMLKKYNLVPADILDHINSVYSQLEVVSSKRLGEHDARNKVEFEDVLTFRHMKAVESHREDIAHAATH